MLKQVQAARAAMMALAALAIMTATPSYAAGLDSGTLNTYSNQPQNPTHQPTNPNLPQGGGVYVATPPDLKVDYISSTSNNGSMTWTYTVKNLGGQAAKGVKMEKVAVRNCFCGSHGIQTETSYEMIGDMIGGAVKNIVVSCVPKQGLSPCNSSSAEAHLTNTDSNPGNNWDVS